MNSIYTEEYLRVLQDTTDPLAAIDKEGNIVYHERNTIKVVKPSEAEAVINEMYGGNI